MILGQDMFLSIRPLSILIPPKQYSISRPFTVGVGID